MINIQEAKTHLSRLVDQAAGGEEIIIAKAGKPMAKLTAYQPRRTKRRGGFLKGRVWESPDAWEPDPELLAAMTEAPVFPSESKRANGNAGSNRSKK